MKERDVTNTSIKIPTGLLERIDRDIAQYGDFRNRSEWIIAAIREYEKQRAALIAQRKMMDSVTQKQNESELGSVDIRTSTAEDVKN